jgi:hypothetical protein
MKYNVFCLYKKMCILSCSMRVESVMSFHVWSQNSYDEEKKYFG